MLSNTTQHTQLWLCLRFELLPLECQTRDHHTPAAVLNSQRRILAANGAAIELGIRHGMGVATARALVDHAALQLFERNPASEQQSLQQLSCWAYSLCPDLHHWRSDSLLLEAGSCLRLYGGAAPLLWHIQSGLNQRGYSANLALADTPRAAWLLSFLLEQDARLDTQSPLDTRLAPLPLKLLETDFSSAVGSLQRAGLTTFGSIMTLPVAALTRRCGTAFSTFLLKTTGREPDLLPPFHPPATFSDQHWFGYEVKANAELLPAMQRLLQSFCNYLRHSQQQTTVIHWQLTAIDGRLYPLRILSESSDSRWESWYYLSQLQLERLQLKAGVEGLTLHCDSLSPICDRAPASDLFQAAGQREDPANLLDRLRNRLGNDAVKRITCLDEHLPELALAVSHDTPPPPARAPAHHQRPFWLLPTPVPLNRQQADPCLRPHDFTLIYGPERIEDNWWQTSACRDYYIARAVNGEYYWLFHDRRENCWFLQGIFS